jgi:hypothetical protein
MDPQHRQSRIDELKAEAGRYVKRNIQYLPKTPVNQHIFDGQRFKSYDDILQIIVDIDSITDTIDSQVYKLTFTTKDNQWIELTCTRIRAIDLYEGWLYYQCYVRK